MAEETKSSRSSEKSGPSRGMLVSLVIVLIVVIGAGVYLWKGMKSSTLTPTPSEIPNFMVDTQESATESAMTNTQTTFSCLEGKTIEATFNNSADARADLVLSDGRTMSLPIAVSGNEVRYVSEDESVALLAQENGISIQENGVETYSQCAPVTPAP